MKDLDDKYKFKEPEVWPEIIVTGQMLSSIRGTRGREELWKAVQNMLLKAFPTHFEGVVYTDEFIRDRAIRYYVDIAADENLTERALVHAHCDQAHQQGKRFTLVLPDDPRTISRTHVSVYGGDEPPKKP